ncbi:hypothetical protein QBC42DRAFT_194578 [Cladorrhinum samala]|uniref:Uncharacterized protein n=1 Tax=Cladorrhinum samala TaxID=585594 RepID=A0AAV9I2X1_9PEZI|nr:hypothetical protein QBC42DRAFT_194578 [Cladorrhinum samala]
MSPRIREKTGSDGLRRRRRSISPPGQREDETPPPPYREHQEVSRSREVFGSVAQHAKATLAFLISLCAVSYLVILGFSITTGSLTESLSPICRLPGVSSLNLPICLPKSPIDAEEKQKKQPLDIDPFLEIQGEFARTVELALRELDITEYDKALEDLKSAGLGEKEEALPHYPNFLGFMKSARQQFDEFHEELASTVSALSTLCGKAAAELTEESTDGLPSWANWNVWKHWILSQFKPGEVHEEWVLDTYATHLGRVFEEVSAVVGDGLRVVKGLDEAGDHFKKVHDIVQEEKEKLDAKKGRFDALAKWLGAGGPDDDKTGEQFDLVGKIDQQHSKTRKQVGELVTRLQDILAQLYALTKVGPFGQEVNQPLEHYRKKIEAQGDNLEATKIRIARFKNPE